MKPSIAIIGAGISGLTIASILKDLFNITVFEKARGVGGRMSTRYVDHYSFDHGTQFFTAKTTEFQEFLGPFISQGTIAEWQGNYITINKQKIISQEKDIKGLWVAIPNMNSLCKSLSKDIEIRTNCEIAPLLIKSKNQWVLLDKAGEEQGCYDLVISTAPPLQTVRLMEEHLPSDCSIRSASFLGCFTLMLGFDHKWDKDWIAAKIQENPINWIAINSTKPNRNSDATSIVVHSSNTWANSHIEMQTNEVQKILLKSFYQATGIDFSKAKFITTHRWRYASCEKDFESKPYYDPALGIACTGDWCEASRIEATWLHAKNLSQDIIRYYGGVRS